MPFQFWFTERAINKVDKVKGGRKGGYANSINSFSI